MLETKKYLFDEIIKGSISLYYFPDSDNKSHLYIKNDDELLLISNKSVEIQPDLITIDSKIRNQFILVKIISSPSINSLSKIDPDIS